MLHALGGFLKEMNQVTIELWLWLGKELEEDFESLSQMRSIKRVWVEEGATIKQLLNRLATRYQAIAERVFDQEEERLHFDVVLTYNDRVISPYEVYNRVLKDGDKITILPMYAGG